MFINNSLKEFLASSAKLSNNAFYITDLNNILLFTTKCRYNEEKLEISRELLEILLDFSNKIFNTTQPYILRNSSNNIVNIIEDRFLNIHWKSQIILPIYIDNSIIGSFIMLNYHQNFSDKDLVFAKTTLSFIEKFILQEKNKEGGKNMETKELQNNTYLFSKKHLTDILNIHDDNLKTLKNIERYNDLEKQFVKLQDELRKKLDEEDIDKLDKMIDISCEIELYLNALFHSLGVKYGMEIGNL